MLRSFLFRPQNHMKLAPASTTVVALCTAVASGLTRPTLAWTPTISLPSRARQFSTFLSSTSAVPVEDPVLEEDQGQTPALQRPVADGNVVSFFRGGLAAIQMNANQSDYLIGRQVVFSNGAIGVVVAQRYPILFCFSDTLDHADGRVQILSSMAQVKVSQDMRMVDCFGRPAAKGNHKRDIFSAIPQIKDIALINSPMLTGVTMIDSLAPIGRGQNMLVIGSDLEKMRGFMTDFLSTQVREGSTKCIYAITQGKEAILERFYKANLLDDIIVVSVRDGIEDADPVSRAAEAIAVSATACAIAESFALDEGQNALVIVDTIDEYKVLWDATTRVLVDVFGADAVVKDDRNGGASSEMRAFYSSLIQRAGQFKQSKGGGSVTLTLLTSIAGDDGAADASVVFDVSDFSGCGDKVKARLDILVKNNIPLTEVNLRKIDIPIPSVTERQRRLVLQHVDDLISMSDGQIWLDHKLAKAGQSPPMDPQRSLTRVGIGADTVSRADAPAVRRMVEGLRLDLSQAASMGGAEVTLASSRQIRKREAWLLAMHQEPGQGGRTLSESCVALLAASIGALDTTIESGGLAGTEQGQFIIRDLLSHVKRFASRAVNEIDETQDIGVDGRNELVEAIKSFFGDQYICGGNVNIGKVGNMDLG